MPWGMVNVQSPEKEFYDKKWGICFEAYTVTESSVDRLDPYTTVSITYDNIIPVSLFYSWRIHQLDLDIKAGLDKCVLTYFEGDYTIKDNIYALFLGVGNNQQFLKFIFGKGNVINNGEKVSHSILGAEFYFTFIGPGATINLMTGGRMIEFYKPNNYHLGIFLQFQNLFHSKDKKSDESYPYYRIDFEPYFYSVNPYSSKKPIGQHILTTLSLGIKFNPSKVALLDDIRIFKGNLVNTGNIVGITGGGYGVQMVFRFDTPAISIYFSPSVFWGDGYELYSGNRISARIMVCPGK